MSHDGDQEFSATEAANDDGDEQAKESQKDAMIRLGSQAELWHDPDQQAFASFSVKGHTENHALRSKPFKSWITRQFSRETKKAPGSQAIEDALRVLDERLGQRDDGGPAPGQGMAESC